MKKLFTSTLCAVMTLSLAACGSSSSTAAAGTAGASTAAAASGSKTLVIYQNKAEVTEPMQTYADAWGKANGATVTVKTCNGSCDYGAGMKADIAAGEAADIFIIEGDTGYDLYKDIMMPLDGEKWADQTDYEYVKDGHTYGYPVAIEGYGLAYNADILEKAGIDPTTLTTLSAYKAAFEKIDSMKDELGLAGTVALTAADGSYWVMAQHDFAGYLSSGNAYDDTTVIDKALKGEVDADRLNSYADWVELLYQYSDKTMLTTGSADDQMAQFGAGKYAFLHQGTWADSPIKDAGGTFKMGFAPYATLGDTACDGLFLGAPSWYVVNKDSKNADLAKQFLNDLCFTTEGQDLMVNKVGLVSAFTNNANKPAGALASALADWIAQGKTAYSFTNQYKTPSGFNMDVLGPIYAQFAAGGVDKAGFIKLFTDAIASIPTYQG